MLYDSSDDIIQYVRAFQKGQTTDIDIESAIKKAKNQSLYSQSLRQGIFYIRGASDFFTGIISKNEFQKIIDKQIT